jgi:hypothetical protein
MIPRFLMIVMIATLCSCKGCRNKIYAVHEDVPYLNLSIEDSTIKSNAVLLYIDSTLSKNRELYDVQNDLNGVGLKPEDRVLHFKANPEESYHVSCNSNPCWIKGIYNSKIDFLNWIYDRKFLDKNELQRISDRFREEVLRNVPH